jgi:Domain of Unknown Function (DUF349)
MSEVMNVEELLSDNESQDSKLDVSPELSLPESTPTDETGDAQLPVLQDPENEAIVNVAVSDGGVEDPPVPELMPTIADPLPDMQPEPVTLDVSETVAEHTSHISGEQTPAVLAETAEASELEALAQAQRLQETQVQAVLSQVLDNPETDYEALLQQASVQELVILQEAIAARPIDRASLRVVALGKKQFDALYGQSLAELNRQLEGTTPADTTEPVVLARQQKSGLTTYSQRFSRALLVYNKKRQIWEETQTVEREANSKLKRELLDKLRELVRGEQVQAISKVRDIQKKWRDIGPVPHTEFEDINESYRALLDQYYGLRAQYNELLEQDRKYNLAEKERLIEEMEAACEAVEDEVDATLWQEIATRVTALHEAWKHVGAIPREETESTWERFKAATDRFYELRRGFFETRDDQRVENTDLKQALVAELVPFAEFTATSKEGWQQASEAVQALQDRWRLIGPAKREVGKQLFKTYRDALNVFYKRRSQFFEGLNAARSGLVVQKQALLEQAEVLEAALATEDVQQLSEKFKNLQREWKQSGPDDYREARKVAKKFRKICDTFFAKLKQSYADQHATELENQTRKEAVATALEQLTSQPPTDGTDIRAAVKELQQTWDATGHVPFKVKDKLFARYRAALAPFAELADSRPPRRDSGAGTQQYNQNPRGPRTGGGPREGGGGKEFRERGGGKERGGKDSGPKSYSTSTDYGTKDTSAPSQDPHKKKLQLQLRKIEETIQQYENNILFISKNKSGDALRAEINEKIAAHVPSMPRS